MPTDKEEYRKDLQKDQHTIGKGNAQHLLLRKRRNIYDDEYTKAFDKGGAYHREKESS